MAGRDRATSFACQTVEVQLAVDIPLLADDPFEAKVTVVHFGLQATQTMRHLPADAALDVLIALRLG